MNPYLEVERKRIAAEIDSCWCNDGRGGPACEECRKNITRIEVIDSFSSKEGEITTPEILPAHYGGGGKMHWDRMWELYREAWFVGNITKYVERYRKKDGINDLKKARTYLNKLIELEEANKPGPNPIKEGEE